LLKEKSNFVFRHRYLIVKRREHLSDREKQDLCPLLEYLPDLRILREFADKLHRLFDPDQSEHSAWCHWQALFAKPEFQAIPEFTKAMSSLEVAKFAKMIAFLRGPWRRRRTVVRYVVLSLDRWWKTAPRQHRIPAHRRNDPAKEKPGPLRESARIRGGDQREVSE
jgi:hypothetical protein